MKKFNFNPKLDFAKDEFGYPDMSYTRGQTVAKWLSVLIVSAVLVAMVGSLMIDIVKLWLK